METFAATAAGAPEGPSDHLQVPSSQRWWHLGNLVKTVLRMVIENQEVSEDALLTVLIEVEDILKAKPLAYVSLDVAEPDPLTPNMLLIGLGMPPYHRMTTSLNQSPNVAGATAKW